MQIFGKKKHTIHFIIYLYIYIYILLLLHNPSMDRLPSMLVECTQTTANSKHVTNNTKRCDAQDAS